MKKLILMTSALTMIGGAAFAEITVGGEASLSYGDWDDDMLVAAGFDYDVLATFDMEETTASGVTYGASLEVSVIDGESAGIMYVSGDFGKFSFGVDEFDATTTEVGEEDSGDIMYEYSMGDFSATIVAEAGLGAEATEPDVDMASWDLAIGYTTGAFTIGVSTDSDEYSDLSVDYDGGSFTAGASFDTDDEWDIYVGTSFSNINAKLYYESDETVGVELDGEAGDVSWALGYEVPGAAGADDIITASVDYAAGDLSVGIAYDSDNAGGFGDDAETILTVGYAFGDMASAEILLNDQEQYELSLTLGFEF